VEAGPTKPGLIRLVNEKVVQGDLQPRPPVAGLTVTEGAPMDVMRSLYILAEHIEFARWLESFWSGDLPSGDCLRELLEPDDLRGDVVAWGGPHWTLLDALTTDDPGAFARVVRAVCSLCRPLTITPEGLSIFGGTSLVVQCKCPEFDRLRAALAEATRPWIARSPLVDEEFQRAEWWIRRVSNDAGRDLAALAGAREVYLRAGSPALPRSRHFRLGFLVRLYKERSRAVGGVESAGERLEHFLTRAEPPWYASTGYLHITIASGLGGTRSLDDLAKGLWPAIRSRLGSFQPRNLAIMGEDPQTAVTVHFFDWITETYIIENRTGFKAVDRVDFA
jgi:hypothetical protein